LVADFSGARSSPELSQKTIAWTRSSASESQNRRPCSGSSTPMRPPTCSLEKTVGSQWTPASGSRSYVPIGVSSVSLSSTCCDAVPGRPSRWSGSPRSAAKTAASVASATCCHGTRRPTGSARGHAVGGHAAGGDTTGDRCDSCDKPPSHDTSRRQRPNSWPAWGRSFLLSALGCGGDIPTNCPRSTSTASDGIPCHGVDGPREEGFRGGLEPTRKIRP